MCRTLCNARARDDNEMQHDVLPHFHRKKLIHDKLWQLCCVQKLRETTPATRTEFPTPSLSFKITNYIFSISLIALRSDFGPPACYGSETGTDFAHPNLWLLNLLFASGIRLRNINKAKQVIGRQTHHRIHYPTQTPGKGSRTQNRRACPVWPRHTVLQDANRTFPMFQKSNSALAHNQRLIIRTYD